MPFGLSKVAETLGVAEAVTVSAFGDSKVSSRKQIHFASLQAITRSKMQR